MNCTQFRYHAHHRMLPSFHAANGNSRLQSADPHNKRFRGDDKNPDFRHAALYDGISELLKKLQSCQISTAVATYKRQYFADAILTHLQLSPHLNVICGSDMEGKLTKTDIIQQTISLAGIQDITLKVTDSAGNVREKTFEFAVSDLTAPVVTLSQGNDVVIDYGSEFKLENYLTATDDLGVVTNTVSGTVDTTKENEVQTIEVTTQDEAENKVVTTLNFTVKDIGGPQINLSTNAVEVVKDSAFDPRQYLVSAIDNKDGDVTANVAVSGIDTSSTGNKTVTYSVSDSSGNQSTATLSVKVYTPGSKIVETAYTKLGTPYVYGASGPNAFDCSGFTSWVYRQHGISIARTAQGQSRGGTPVDRANLQPGDLVFFGSSTSNITHVGIYIGGGQMVHAPHTGDVVKVSSLNRNYVCARRYL